MVDERPQITPAQLAQIKIDLTSAMDQGDSRLHIATDRFHALAGVAPNLAIIADTDAGKSRPMSLISAVLIFENQSDYPVLPIVSLLSH